MRRFLFGGFLAGTLLGAYGNAFGPVALAIVLVCGLIGAAVSGGVFLAMRVDRARLLALLGELDG